MVVSQYTEKSLIALRVRPFAWMTKKALSLGVPPPGTERIVVNSILNIVTSASVKSCYLLIISARPTAKGTFVAVQEAV